MLFGSIGSGRPPALPGVESILGMFVSTLPVCVDLGQASFGSPGTPVVEWLQRLQEAQLEARGFDFTPLAEIHKWSSLPAGGQLFDSCLSFQSYPLDEALAQRSGSLSCRSFDILEEPGFPLMVVVSPGRVLRLTAEYRRERFTATAVARLLRHLRTLLEELVAEPALTLDRWSAVTAAERHQLLLEWSRGRHRKLGSETVCSLFSRRAAAYPDAVAADDGEKQLTFAQLRARVSALAVRLRQAGAGTETVVGLCVERSLDLPVGLLAILEAGAVALPLDPEHPAQRLSFALGDSGARLVVTQQRVLDRLPELAAAGRSAVLADGTDSPETAELSLELPAESLPRPEHLAYLVYTSGSTGRPKGVLVDHRALLNYCRSMIRRCDFGPQDRMLQFASPAFNVLIEEVFPVLLAGGAVVLHREDLLLAPAQLQRVLEEKRVTAVELPAAFWQEWVQDLDARGSAPPAALRLLLLGCERPRRRMLEIWRRFGVRLVYVFGLTETTITSSLHELPLHQPVGRSQLPIGRPLANTRLYVLDRHLQPVPAGVVGQLYIGGEGVGRGYRRRPELTAARFVPDPWAQRPGRRLYRTGDRARHRSDGALEFLGRLDYQLKIRGFRVEPGEVEAVLESRPEVRRAVVAAHVPSSQGAAGGAPRLVAYVVPEAAAPDFGALRRSLESRLPDYMVPSRFVQLDELPLNPNGKVDRKALPAPDLDPAAAQRAYTAPRNDTEELLAEIWGQVLGLSRVGVEDNFFELGGDSILSIQITARANRAGIGITARQLFEHPTVAGLANAAEGSPVSVAEQGAVTGRVPLTPVQRWLLEQDRRRPEHFNLPLVLELRPQRGERWAPEILEHALSHLLRHHDQLRARFRRDPAAPGEWIQELPAPDLESVDLTVVRSEASASEGSAAKDLLPRLGAELQGGLNLEAGRLLRGLLVNPPGEASQKLLLALHHLVVDAVSWRVLVEDLMQAYEAVAAGREPTLPPKTTSFLHWARRLEDWAASGRALAEAEYWLAEEKGASLPLPVDDADGITAEGTAETFTTRLSAVATEALAGQLPRAYRAGFQDALLAALGRAVADWSGSERVRVELEGHGRREQLFDDVDLSRTVGWFTALYPMVLDLTPPAGLDPGAEAELVAVKEQLRGVPGDGVGYGVLRYLAPDGEIRRRLAAQPEAEILFNYVGRIDAGDLGDEDGAGDELPVRLSTEDPGAPIDPQAPRTHLLAVNAGLRHGELEVAWTFSPEVHRRSTVEAVAGATVAALEALAEHCQGLAAGRRGGLRTPSDFPLVAQALEAPLDIAALQALLAGVDEVEDLYPLSPLQEGMVFHGLYEPGSVHYVAQVLCRLHGDLDRQRFHDAWSATAARHPVLRTAYRWQGLERPLQVVEQRVAVPLATADLRGRDDAEEELARLLEADRARGFDLDRAPLQRLTLARLGERDWQMVWTFHQSTFDGWSLPVLFRDFLNAYGGGSSEGAAMAPVAAPPPYRRYIAWLQEQDLEEAEDFWRRTLEDFEAATPLPYDHPPAEAPDHRRHSLSLSAEATEELQRLARRSQLTVNTLVQAAWALLLGQLSGEADVVFGGTVAGRPAELEGVEGMVGLFINTLPVRVELDPGATVLPWLRQLRDRLADQRHYEYTPLASIQRWSEVAAGEQLFDSFLVFQNYPMEPILARGAAAMGSGEEAPGALEVRDYRTDERPHFSLSLVVHPVADLLFELIYDASRFDGVTVQRMLGYLHGWLGALAADPWARLGSLSPFSDAQRHQLRVEWVVPVPESAGPPEALTVGEHFHRQATRQPQVSAVIWGEEELSYGELEVRCNQLAHHLIGLGVTVDQPVALCVERSANLVVALLAILKAGGAYVPVADDYPTERQQYMFEDCGGGVLITDRQTAGKLPAFPGHTVILEEAREHLDTLPSHHPPVPVHRDCLAYVNYTSGSTGKPKGTGLTHRGVERLALRTNYADFESGERMVQGASVSFDAATYEIWATVLAGATLVGLPREVTLSPSELAAALERYQVENLFLTTALVHQVGREAPETFAGLRRVMFGGEAVEPRWIRAILEHGAPEHLFHFYGPTENTTYSTWHPVHEAPEGAATLPIGRAVAHSTVYVVDRQGRLVPPGVAGELWVGGDGLARGYLGRPAKTAEGFIPDPFQARRGLEGGDGAGSRVYRTGDLVRWNAQGALEFVGRADNQVKVRGFRIELGEIEAALLEHPRVADALVLLREDNPGEKRLAGYVAVGEGEELLSTGELRDHLLERLPKFMVPAAFVVLETFPLTANGKLDRRALPVPEVQRGELGVDFQAPVGEIQERLAEIFAAVLRLPEVGADDNFFELGGDSILSIQLVSRAKAAGLHLTPRQLFEHPTVAQLAEVAQSGTAVVAEQEVLTGELPMLPIQHLFLEQSPEIRDHFNMPLLLAIREPLDAALLDRALVELQRHHDALRLRLVRREEKAGGWHLRYAPPEESSPLQCFDLSGLPESQRRGALEEIAGDLQGRLDLEHGPVLRCAFFDLGGGDGRLLLIPHHLVMDGVSWRVVLEDLDTAYRQLSSGDELRLPPKTTSFRAWAEALEARAGSGALAHEAELWAKQNRRTAAALPLDHPDGDEAVGLSAVASVELGEEETRQLVQEVPRAYRTELQEVLLTAAARALLAWAGGEAVRIDLEGHGREEELVDGVDLSRTVGWFTVLYPVVLEPGNDPDPGACLRAVKQQVRRIPEKGLGYGLLHHLPIVKAGDLTPVRAEVSFNYLGQLDQALPEGALWAPATEGVGEAVHPRRRREHRLQIDAQILDRRLAVDWSYSSGQLRRSTVDRLAASFLEELRSLIAHCLSSEAGEVSADDFGLAELDDDDLAAALDQVGFGEF